MPAHCCAKAKLQTKQHLLGQQEKFIVTKRTNLKALTHTMFEMFLHSHYLGRKFYWGFIENWVWYTVTQWWLHCKYRILLGESRFYHDSIWLKFFLEQWRLWLCGVLIHNYLRRQKQKEGNVFGSVGLSAR